jgi:hypothetical protein
LLATANLHRGYAAAGDHAILMTRDSVAAKIYYHAYLNDVSAGWVDITDDHSAIPLLSTDAIDAGLVWLQSAATSANALADGPAMALHPTADAAAARVSGARFPTAIYSRGCHWVTRLLA